MKGLALRFLQEIAISSGSEHFIPHQRHESTRVSQTAQIDLSGSIRYLPMRPCPLKFRCKTMSFARCALFLTLCGGVTMRGAETTKTIPLLGDDSAIPQSVKEGDLKALIANSPFTRSLGVSDSIILTGVAHINDDVFATLLDTETMQSQVVSKTSNIQGWQLIGVSGNPAESRTWAAKIQVTGGQVISVRYQKPPTKRTRLATAGSNSNSGSSTGNTPPLSSSQKAEAKNAAVNYREGFTSDGYPQQPPPEMVAKLSRLSVGQREDINREMLGLRNKGLGMDERRKIYENLVDRSSQERR